jgi:hypothetical protein
MAEKNLKLFLEKSQTLQGVAFSGNYTMSSDVFLALYSHYEKTGENLLDAYSEVLYAIWEANSNSTEYHDYDWCDKIDNYQSIFRKIKIFNPENLWLVSSYVREKRNQYREMLERIRNTPRRNACRYTSKKKIRNLVFDLYGKQCLSCQNNKDLTIDHIIPVEKGGLNEIENMQPLCRSCNSKKGTNIKDYRKP